MPLRRMLLATVLFACTPALAQIPDDLTEPGQLPPSAGFQNPDDISVLLDYRLPDWWSRVWTAGLELNGSANRYDGNFSRFTNNAFRSYLATGAAWRFDGERTQAFLSADLQGTFRKSRAGGASPDRLNRDYEAASSVQADGRRYVTDRWAVALGGGGSWSYDERVGESSGQEARYVGRAYDVQAFAGLGYGRVRDVTPAIRAARLNERLVALGHSPLATAEILRVAQALSRQAAYAGVFDRPDRRFWADVLAPVTARQNLSPYETFYLAEVLQENVGYRSEGWTVDAGLGVDYTHEMQNQDEMEATGWGPEFRADWSHNFSLDHQLSASGMAWARRSEFTSWHAPGRSEQDGFDTQVSLEYLWAVADRCLWSTRLAGSSSYSDMESENVLEILRVLQGQFTSEFTFYVEDRLALRPSVSFHYREEDEPGESVSRSFNYRLVFAYELDRTLN